MSPAITRRQRPHLFVPTTFVVIALIVAIISSRPDSSTTESAGGVTTFAQSADIIDPESVPHTHPASAEETSDGHVHDVATAATDAVHQHSDGESSSTNATSPDGHSHATPAPDLTPTGPIISVDDPRLTQAQRDAARALLVSTRSTIASLPDVGALATAGYVSVGDNSSGLQHWVNDGFTHDSRELDSSRIESFVVKISTGRAVGAMYMLEPGKTMSSVPDIAGELTIWHVHNPICFSTNQIWRFVSFANNGNCAPGSAVRNVPPMMHVWLDDPECGPFVGTEGHGSTSCSAHQH